MHNMHACRHIMHLYYACMHNMHASYACIICVHVCMHIMHACYACMHACVICMHACYDALSTLPLLSAAIPSVFGILLQHCNRSCICTCICMHMLEHACIHACMCMHVSACCYALQIDLQLVEVNIVDLHIFARRVGRQSVSRCMTAQFRILQHIAGGSADPHQVILQYA